METYNFNTLTSNIETALHYSTNEAKEFINFLGNELGGRIQGQSISFPESKKSFIDIYYNKKTN